MGIALFVAGVAIIRANNIDPAWQKVSGQVVTLRRIPGTQIKSNSYTAQLRYVVNNKIYTVDDRTGENMPPAIGSNMLIAYNPISPSQSKIVEADKGKVVSRAMVLVGVILVILAVIKYIGAVKK